MGMGIVSPTPPIEITHVLVLVPTHADALSGIASAVRSGGAPASPEHAVPEFGLARDVDHLVATRHDLVTVFDGRVALGGSFWEDGADGLGMLGRVEADDQVLPRGGRDLVDHSGELDGDLLILAPGRGHVGGVLILNLIQV